MFIYYLFFWKNGVIGFDPSPSLVFQLSMFGAPVPGAFVANSAQIVGSLLVVVPGPGNAKVKPFWLLSWTLKRKTCMIPIE
jgi:hypothetical protein